jgi:hypothetical protein
VVKSKTSMPFELSTLVRWLALKPKEHFKELETRLARSSEAEYRRLQEPARVALRLAWDEQPDVFFPLANAWIKGSNARLRRVAAGALPVSHDRHAEKCLRALKKLSTDKDRETRLIAIDLLAEDPDKLLSQLAKWAKLPDPDVQAIVARHLRNVSTDLIKKALTILLELADQPEGDVPWNVASTLYDLHARENRAVLEVAHKMAVSQADSTRSAIAGSFFQLVFADHFDQLLPTLRSWLRVGEPELRWTLVRSLKFLRVTARSLQLLRALYEDRDPDVRRRVVVKLIESFDFESEQLRSVAELLRRAKEDHARRVREVAEDGEARLGVQFDKINYDGTFEGSEDDEGGDTASESEEE